MVFKRFESKLSVDAAWMLTGNGAWAFAQFLIGVVLIREAGATAAGQYALGLTIATPVSLLTSLSLRSVLVTDPHAVADFAQYRRLRLISAAVALTTTVIIAWVIGGPTGLVVTLVGVGKAISSIVDIYIGLFQRAQQARAAGGAMAVNAVATVVFGVGILMVTPDAAVAAFGAAVGSAVSLLVYCLPRADRIHPPAGYPARNPTLSGLALVALPMGISAPVAAFAVSVPRLMVAGHLSLAALGVFTAIGYAMTTTNLFAAGVTQALLPRMSVLFEAGQCRTLVKITALLAVVSVALGTFVAVVCLAAGGGVLEWIYGAGYGQYTAALAIVIAAAGVSGAVFVISTALTATRRFGSQLTASVVYLAATAGLAWLLVPHGITPAMWTLLLPLLVDGAVKAEMLRRAVRHQPVRVAPVPAR